MPLVVDQLQLWTIGFKWANLDPGRTWLRLPAPVRDNFSTLLEAILSDQLDCITLASEKYKGDDPDLAKYYIRYWLDAVYEGIRGSHYNRDLLKHAVIEREAFQRWCDRRTIPLPEFWFPPGWTDYRWPEYDPEPSASRPTTEAIAEAEVAGGPGSTDHMAAAVEAPPQELKDNQIARIASQQIARVIWKEEPDRTIAAMCKDELVLKYGGANFYGEETVRRWLKAVAPAEVSAKRGRPRKKNPADDK